MAKAITAKRFDYSVVDKDAKSKLIWYAAEIGKQQVAHATAGLEMGRMLAEARELCSDKPFVAWVETECGCSVSTAYRYMDAHREFGDFPTVGKIELGAMYALTKNKSAKAKAIKLADKGVVVTQSMAKKLVKESKPKPPPDSPDDAPEPEDEAEPDSEPETPQTEPESPEQADLGTCPNCGKAKWTKDGDWMVCAKCNHTHGEPAGDVDEDRIKTQRQKTVKTAEALLRAFDDLQLMKARLEYDEAILRSKQLLQIAKEWR